MGCCPQHFLTLWVITCLLIGWLVVLAGGAAGAAMLGSAAGALVALPFSWHGSGLETLGHRVVIGSTIGAVMCGLIGLAFEPDALIDRYLRWLALVPVIVGTLVILRLHQRAGQTCDVVFARPGQPPRLQPMSCFRGFEQLWVQALLAFQFALFALLFWLQAMSSSRAGTAIGSSHATAA
jgi:hypothetical protein